MKKTRPLFLLIGLAVVIICPLLTGCGHGNDSTMSTEDQKNFRGGGPMPPEAIKAMQGGGKPAAAGAPGGPAPAAPGKP